MSVEKFFPAKLEQLRRAAEQLTNLTTYPFPNTRADRKSTRLNSSHAELSRMPSSA